MAITEAFSGSEAVSTTEWSLTTDTSGPDSETSDGVYQLWLDLDDMVNTDILQIRGYETIDGGQEIFFEEIIRDAQAMKIWVSPSFCLTNGWDFTLDALAGTITVNWSIRKVA